MWVLPDGTDLRLCRLAMAGLGLACNGRLLLSAAEADELAEADGGSQVQLQLAVQPAVLGAWLAWQAAAVAEGSELVGAAEGMETRSPAAAAARLHAAQELVEAAAHAPHHAAAAAAAVLVPGLEFTIVQGAVLAAQQWVWRTGGRASTRERVCSTHLCHRLAPGGACCAWLRTCQLGNACKLQGLPDEIKGTVAELEAVASNAQEYLVRQRAALDALLPSWLKLGALFHELAD